MCRVVKLRGNPTGPGRAGVLRRQAKGEMDGVGGSSSRLRVCRGVKLRGNSTGRGRVRQLSPARPSSPIQPSLAQSRMPADPAFSPAEAIPTSPALCVRHSGVACLMSVCSCTACCCALHVSFGSSFSPEGQRRVFGGPLLERF